jgi:hypothetical protein
MEGAYELHNHPIAVPEPERAIFNCTARGIAVLRIGDCFLRFSGEPKTGLALLESRRQGCEIDLRNYRELPFL